MVTSLKAIVLYCTAQGKVKWIRWSMYLNLLWHLHCVGISTWDLPSVWQFHVLRAMSKCIVGLYNLLVQLNIILSLGSTILLSALLWWILLFQLLHLFFWNMFISLSMIALRQQKRRMRNIIFSEEKTWSVLETRNDIDRHWEGPHWDQPMCGNPQGTFLRSGPAFTNISLKDYQRILKYCQYLWHSLTKNA